VYDSPALVSATIPATPLPSLPSLSHAQAHTHTYTTPHSLTVITRADEGYWEAVLQALPDHLPVWEGAGSDAATHELVLAQLDLQRLTIGQARAGRSPASPDSSSPPEGKR